MPIENIYDLINWKPPDIKSIISEGVLLPENRMIIFGPAKSWKSMLSIHTAFTLATGEPWFNYKTSKSVVFIFQVELPKNVFRDRVIKYAKGRFGSYPNNLPPNILFESEHYTKLDTSFGMAMLDKELEEVRRRFPDLPLVLILDPLYKLMSGHITDEYDVRRILDNLDELRKKHSMSIIIIHHSRLTRLDASGNIIDLGPEEAMGSSYLNNWTDTMIQVKLLNPHTGADKTEMSFVLVRHGESVLPSFQSIGVELTSNLL